MSDLITGEVVDMMRINEANTFRERKRNSHRLVIYSKAAKNCLQEDKEGIEY